MTADLLAILPEIIILSAGSLILLVDLFLRDEQRHLSYWLTQFALLLAACVTLQATRMEVVHV
ncbi:MAG: NADH:ubiquinone oxidoreductase subunit N, partial [Betaproteobacteria bacterium]|nr:NADH:ubiquinone oxidoreductase subunit N [Betaproteobacteria bacterium]